MTRRPKRCGSCGAAATAFRSTRIGSRSGWQCRKCGHTVTDAQAARFNQQSSTTQKVSKEPEELQEAKAVADLSEQEQDRQDSSSEDTGIVEYMRQNDLYEQYLSWTLKNDI